MDRLTRDRYIAYIGARVDYAVLDALRTHAREREDSVSELVRVALSRYLASEGVEVTQGVWRSADGVYGWPEQGLFP